MGKTHKKKGSRVARVIGTDPVGNPIGSSKRKEEEILDMPENPEEILGRISSQLQDASSEVKECGLQSLSLMADKEHEKIIQLKLVRMAAPLMFHGKSHSSVRHSAIGALKNLSLVSAQVCDEMIKQDVMTPLCKLIKTFSGADWSPASAEQKPKLKDGHKLKACDVIDPQLEIFIESVNLLWNLCEANPTALSIFNKDCLVEILLRHLENVHGKFTPRVLMPVLQCLYTVTEDNRAIYEKVLHNKTILENILTNEDQHFRIDDGSQSDMRTENPTQIYMQILSLGILMNVQQQNSEDDSKNFEDKILPGSIHLIGKALDLDQRKMCNEFTSLCPLQNGEPRESGEFTGNDEEEGASPMEVIDESQFEKLDQLREKLDHTIQAQQTALEILTNICCGAEDGNSQWEDINESDYSDDSSSCGAASTDGMEQDDDELFQPNNILVPSFLTELIRNENIVHKVVSKAELPPKNVCQILRDDAKGYGGKMLLKMLSTLRSRTFLCLNNLVAILSAEELGGSDNLFQIWTNLGSICFGDGQRVDDMDLLESATSAMRAVTEKLRECKSIKFSAMSEEDLKRILSAGAECSEARVRMNLVHIAGSVGLAMVSDPSNLSVPNVPLNHITSFLCDAATRDINLRVVAESLDKIIDIFSEDETDKQFEESLILAKLKQLLPGLKTKIGMKRGTLNEEDHSLILMAKTNLVRFIKYKEKRGLK